MKLFKNVGLQELKDILKNGILPISVTGNDNWEENYRSNNSREVVYLFKPKGKLNTFMQYGLVLLEVETENVVKNEFMENDINKDFYDEYVKNEIKPEEIKSIYIPKIFRKQIEKTNFLKGIENQIIWVDLKESPEELKDYEDTVNVSDFYNYLRGKLNARVEKKFFYGEFVEVEMYDEMIDINLANTIIF